MNCHLLLPKQTMFSFLERMKSWLNMLGKSPSVGLDRTPAFVLVTLLSRHTLDQEGSETGIHVSPHLC